MNQENAMERIANSVSLVLAKGYFQDPQESDFVDFLPNTDPFEVEHEQPLRNLRNEEWVRLCVHDTAVALEEHYSTGATPCFVIPADQFTRYGVKRFMDLMLRFNLEFEVQVDRDA